MAHSAACQVSSSVLYYYFNSISRYEDVELVSSSLSQKWITASLSLQQCNFPPAVQYLAFCWFQAGQAGGGAGGRGRGHYRDTAGGKLQAQVGCHCIVAMFLFKNK